MWKDWNKIFVTPPVTHFPISHARAQPHQCVLRRILTHPSRKIIFIRLSVHDLSSIYVCDIPSYTGVFFTSVFSTNAFSTSVFSIISVFSITSVFSIGISSSSDQVFLAYRQFTWVKSRPTWYVISQMFFMCQSNLRSYTPLSGPTRYFTHINHPY